MYYTLKNLAKIHDFWKIFTIVRIWIRLDASQSGFRATDQGLKTHPTMPHNLDKSSSRLSQCTLGRAPLGGALTENPLYTWEGRTSE